MAEFKATARGVVSPVVATLDRAGFSPTAVSITGLAITAVSGVVIGQGHLLGGALVFLLGSAFDMLDGDLARRQGTVSRRGAFLDSCFDRLGEAFLFAGLTWYFSAGAPNRANQNGIFLLGPTIMEFGTEEQKQRFLTPMAKGEVVWAQAWSEPGAGSDMAAISSKAVRDGNQYVINGQKTWSSRAGTSGPPAAAG